MSYSRSRYNFRSKASFIPRFRVGIPNLTNNCRTWGKTCLLSKPIPDFASLHSPQNGHPLSGQTRCKLEYKSYDKSINHSSDDSINTIKSFSRRNVRITRNYFALLSTLKFLLWSIPSLTTRHLWVKWRTFQWITFASREKSSQCCRWWVLSALSGICFSEINSLTVLQNAANV